MTVAYWSVLAAALIPYLFVGYSKSTTRFLKGGYNKNPREYEEALSGARKRAYWAQLNGFEAFPPFAAAVVIAHLTGGSQARIDTLALAFVGLRLAHGVLYVLDRDALRSIAWTGSVACVVALFLAGA